MMGVACGGHSKDVSISRMQFVCQKCLIWQSADFLLLVPSSVYPRHVFPQHYPNCDSDFCYDFLFLQTLLFRFIFDIIVAISRSISRSISADFSRTKITLRIDFSGCSHGRQVAATPHREIRFSRGGFTVYVVRLNERRDVLTKRINTRINGSAAPDQHNYDGPALDIYIRITRHQTCT